MDFRGKRWLRWEQAQGELKVSGGMSRRDCLTLPRLLPSAIRESGPEHSTSIRRDVGQDDSRPVYLALHVPTLSQVGRAMWG